MCCVRWGKLADTAREIVEIAVHLLERKTECEDALHAFQWQVSRQTLVAQRRHFGSEAVERGLERSEWRRRATRQQCGGARMIRLR